MFDDREVRGLEQVLAKVPGAVGKEAEKIVARGAFNIKRDAAKRISGLAHARAYPLSITYDTYAGLHGPAAEIGPDKTRRQGALGNLLEYGSVNNPPHPHMRPAAEAELPKFERALQDAAARALEGR